MNLVNIKLKDLTENKSNPPIRVDRASGEYKRLLKSISNWGLIEPITISNDNVIVNGTRRATVFSDLGKTKIQAVKLNSDSHKVFDQLFVQCNVVQKISGAQWAWRYLMKTSVPKNLKGQLDHLKRIGGIGCIRRIVALNKSPISFYAGLAQYRNYTGKVLRKDLRKSIYWMLNVGSAYRLKMLIGEFVPIQLLVNAIDEKRDIKITTDGGWSLV